MVLTDKIRRPSALATALVLFLTSLVPLLVTQSASAYALLGPRQVRMSTSQVSATGASYRVKFRVTSDATDLGGIVVSFCQTTPIIGDTTCTVPAGFTLNGVTVNGQTTGAADEGDATADISTLTTTQIEDHDGTGDTDQNTLTLSNATAVTAASIDANDYVAFTINGVVNPSATGSFYARIYTYDTEAEAQGYTLADPHVVGQAIDAGGIALSTADQITVTAKVQERLVFCVYTTGAGNDCTGKSGTSVTLGDTNGVLDPSGVYVDKNAKYSITTNASGNAIVRAKGATLTSGSFTVDAFGAPNTSTPGSEEFGFCAYQSAGAGMTIDADYDGGAGAECSGTTQSAGTGTPGGDNSAEFAFVTAGLSSTYGDDVATKPAGSYSTGIIVFAGNISNTTEAGIYTSTMTFIATGSY
jgi:hypothetical protein